MALSEMNYTGAGGGLPPINQWKFSTKASDATKITDAVVGKKYLMFYAASDTNYVERVVTGATVDEVLNPANFMSDMKLTSYYNLGVAGEVAIITATSTSISVQGDISVLVLMPLS